MNLDRRSFLHGALCTALAGCVSSEPPPKPPRVGLQLYSIRGYLKKHGLEKTLHDVRALGYEGVQFAPGTATEFHGFTAGRLRHLLMDAGLEACGTHLSRTDLAPDVIRRTIDYNLAIGNVLLSCPGGGMLPGKDWKGSRDDWWKFIVDFYFEAAETAAHDGCFLALHNHDWEFKERTHGTCMWDYFFANVPAAVCMEIDVGSATGAGVDPLPWYARYPHRSWSVHAREHGSYEKGSTFRGVLGAPGCDPAGKKVTGVDWDKLFPVLDADGVKWFVVECEADENSLDAARESFAFLRRKGRC